LTWLLPTVLLHHRSQRTAAKRAQDAAQKGRSGQEGGAGGEGKAEAEGTSSADHSDSSLLLLGLQQPYPLLLPPQAAEDKTFGLKNKNKSVKVQK
jgi:hypothetical protein